MSTVDDVQHKKGDTSKGCNFAILSGFLSYNTRKGIRQRVAILQRLQYCQDSFLVLYVINTRKVIRQKVAICHLCHLSATSATLLPPFCHLSKNTPTTVNPRGVRVYSVHFYFCHLCHLFLRVLLYREFFYFFFIFPHNHQKQVA